MNADFQVATHAIGDNANMRVLDNYERLIGDSKDRAIASNTRKFYATKTLCDLLAWRDPVNAGDSRHFRQEHGRRPTRSSTNPGCLCLAKTSGLRARIANGSDFPVEHPNPFYGLHASVTRQDQQSNPPGGWFSEEA